MTISIQGSYMTQFGELWDKSLRDLLAEAINGAITDAGLENKEIEAVFVANKAAGLFENQLHLGALASSMLGHFPPAQRVEGACASGGLAMVAAEQALLSGLYKTVLVVGVEKMTDVSAAQTTQILSAAADYQLEKGSTFPALYALLANIHMHQFGTTRDQLSAVAVKNHEHALKNPKAQFHKNCTIEQVNQSSLVADPLRLLDCSPISDGAAAVVLTTKKVVNKPTIVGFGQGQDTLDLANRSDLTSLLATKKAAALALERSRVSLQSIKVAEVHDCFTIAEILAIEDLGFFAPGKGGPATVSGQTTFDGKVVINPSGGLKACGHPVGATGVKQVAFLNQFLQQHDYQYALAHNVGGSGATAIVHILKK